MKYQEMGTLKLDLKYVISLNTFYHWILFTVLKNKATSFWWMVLFSPQAQLCI